MERWVQPAISPEQRAGLMSSWDAALLERNDTALVRIARERRLVLEDGRGPKCVDLCWVDEVALTLIDLLTQPQVIADGWTYFRDVQTKDRKYKSFLSATDQPPTSLNADIMAKYRPLMRQYYYNPSKYSTYLDQLGIKYPTIRPKAATN